MNTSILLFLLAATLMSTLIPTIHGYPINRLSRPKSNKEDSNHNQRLVNNLQPRASTAEKPTPAPESTLPLSPSQPEPEPEPEGPFKRGENLMVPASVAKAPGAPVAALTRDNDKDEKKDTSAKVPHKAPTGLDALRALTTDMKKMTPIQFPKSTNSDSSGSSEEVIKGSSTSSGKSKSGSLIGTATLQSHGPSDGSGRSRDEDPEDVAGSPK